MAMRKLQLKDLSIESYATLPVEAGRATVQGHEATNRPTCSLTCEGVHSCDYSAACVTVAAGTC
ncbi:MAG TPA: hypothetical protein VFS20_00450 [Longimicrobium sp.]|nr:hypothetical protein [Longimicrobium sp.]